MSEEAKDESKEVVQEETKEDPYIVALNRTNEALNATVRVVNEQSEAIKALGKIVHEQVLPSLSVLAQRDSKGSSNPREGAEDLVSKIAEFALKGLDFLSSSGGQSVLKMFGNAFKEPDPRVQEYEDFKSKMMNHNLKMFDLKLESVEMDNAAKRKRLEGERPFWE